MKDFMERFKGMKTYIVAIVTGGMGMYMQFNPDFTMPGWVWPVLAASGLGAIRAGLPKK